MGDKGERIWLKSEVYKRFKELKPKGMTDNLFMTYLLNLYEKEGREQLERVWGLFSPSGNSTSSIGTSEPEERTHTPVPDTDFEGSDLEGWDI